MNLYYVTLNDSEDDHHTLHSQQLACQPTSEERSEAMIDAVQTLLLGVGEDPDREGLQKTPKRVA